MREELLKAWDAYCRDDIKDTPVILTEELKAHISAIDFTIFGYTPVLQVIQQHMKTPFYVARFGLGLPPRPSTAPPPTDPGPGETRYVEQLFEAYSHNRGKVISAAHELPLNLRHHYNRSREAFYSAEALRNFSRDKLPGDEFAALQDQVYVGVVDTCFRSHACGFTRLVATTDRAAVLKINSSPLIGKTDISDLHGICHQLANEDRLIWVEQEEDRDAG